jgi:hypothetical protein
MANVKKRTTGTTVMLSDQERKELRLAADQAGLPLSVFIRMVSVAAVRNGQTINVGKAA